MQQNIFLPVDSRLPIWVQRKISIFSLYSIFCKLCVAYQNCFSSHQSTLRNYPRCNAMNWVRFRLILEKEMHVMKIVYSAHKCMSMTYLRRVPTLSLHPKIWGRQSCRFSSCNADGCAVYQNDFQLCFLRTIRLHHQLPPTLIYLSQGFPDVKQKHWNDSPLMYSHKSGNEYVNFLL